MTTQHTPTPEQATELVVAARDFARSLQRSKVTEAMLRELRSMERDGNPSDPYEWTHAPEALWFHARDKVIGALVSRGLIVADTSGYTVTDAGRAALAAAGVQS